MSVGPFDTGLAIARLRAQAPTFKVVQGAAELAAVLTQGTPVTPAAYVLLATERPAPKKGASGGVVIQDVEVTFAVAILLRNYRVEQMGDQVRDAFRPLLIEARQALMGWAPDAFHAGCELGDGRLTRYDAGLLTWTQLFRTAYQARKTP